MLHQFEKTVEVSGRGATGQQAVAQALSQVQRAVKAGDHQVLIRIIPENVRVIEAAETRRTERFLFFFLPRERKSYRVRLEVSVSIMMMDVDAIPFSTQAKTFFHNK